MGKVNNDLLLQKHIEGLTDKELSEFFNVPNQWISIKRRKIGLVENKKSTLIKSLTPKEEQIILGHILGDGHLKKGSYSKRCGTSGTIVHGPKQEEYIKWKIKELNRLVTPLKKLLMEDRLDMKLILIHIYV